ncbi:MAG: GNAT family N-acetyltransferase [Trueperella sp.]|nr:GNAT family N-acetyltransferase [Trueperella sp.]
MRFLRRDRLRRLHRSDFPAALELLDEDPVATVLIRTALENHSATLPAHALGYFDYTGELSAVCWNGANIVPYGFTASGLAALAAHLTTTGLTASSIVGAAEQVLALWELIAAKFPPPREIRPRQLSMVYQGQPQVPADQLVRPAQPGEGALIVPTAFAMFEEEVGYDPRTSGNVYTKYVHQLVNAGHTFVRIQQHQGKPRVEFKAEVGALSGQVAQIQGVWVPPELRNRGIGASAMVAVAQQVQAKFAPIVSLYVNDYNLPAVRTYEKAGFVTVGTYATVLL